MTTSFLAVDEKETAQEATDVCNYVFSRQNEGFMVLNTMFKDALIQKNGIVKFWMDESEEQSREEYDGLTDEALLQMLDPVRGAHEVVEVHHRQAALGLADVHPADGHRVRLQGSAPVRQTGTR